MLFTGDTKRNGILRPRQKNASPIETNFLFVYGLLMRGLERADFLNNPDKASFIGKAEAAGVLYDVGAFPGMIASQNGGVVYGELYELHDPEIFFETLDLIEGYWPDQPERSLSIRKIISVATASGPINAWAYLLNLPSEGLPQIPSGNFRAYQPVTGWLDD
ncbi:gamma-glutamylcyclotransferase [candidate division KSB1 bacterium]|nr:MAG: gamma-glutamylcyclotransferase [candidate division KSB1 bacterium]MBC6948775.1 gamma-glutamylcyclotransferase [candidate division KSB1 bacterium]MCE7943708.1 gamma-glutamylcyclotransferase [Chlorobi bacterium CHB1]MDL1874881.1 gamma-glutamylcyclotransferase [Cytophagia bacterium CHB2]